MGSGARQLAPRTSWRRSRLSSIAVFRGTKSGRNRRATNTEPCAHRGERGRAAHASASYCYSDDRKPTIYFSDAFDTAGLPSSTAWSTAFTKMLAQKYAYKGAVTCKTVATIVSAQSAMRDQRDSLQGKQFIDTDWTYEPPAPTPAP